MVPRSRFSASETLGQDRSRGLDPRRTRSRFLLPPFEERVGSVRCSGRDRLAHTALSTLALVGALAFVSTGCTETRQQGKVQIVQRVAAANPDSATTVNVDAACASDEKLIGGGYAFPEPPL